MRERKGVFIRIGLALSVFGLACEQINRFTSGQPSATPETLPTSTLAAGVPGSIETPLPPDVLAIREELLGKNEITSWDAEKSLPGEINTTSMGDWAYRVGYEISRGVIKKGEVRTFDQIFELMDTAVLNWSVGSLSEARGTNSIAEDGRYVWAASGEDGNLPRAKDSAQVLWYQAEDVLKNLLGKDPSEAEIGRVYENLFTQLMRFKGWRDSEILVTRNTYPGEAGDKRINQPENEICSRYEPSVKRGQEYIDKNGVLHLSNEAKFAFIFALSDKVIEVDDVPDDRMAVVQIKDVNGKTWYLHARVFDLSSQPDDLGPTPEGAISESRGWGSQVLPMCGPRGEVEVEQPAVPRVEATQPPQATHVPPSQVPHTSVPPTGVPPTERLSDTPFPQATDTPMPATEVPSTEVPPATDVPPTAPIPTAAPTNVDIIPTATQGN